MPLHDFRLTLGDSSIVVKGRIIHSSITDIEQDTVVYRSGVEFVKPSTRAQIAIDEFREAVRTGRLTV